MYLQVYLVLKNKLFHFLKHRLYPNRNSTLFEHENKQMQILLNYKILPGKIYS